MKPYYFYIALFFVSITFHNCGDFENVTIDHSPFDTELEGSTAKFTIIGDFLYAASSNNLITFNINAPNMPIYSTEIAIGSGVERIFSFAGKLFVGARSGMLIFDIATDGTPELRTSDYEYIKSCQPVAFNGQYAYVSVRNDDECRTSVSANEIQILDITDILNPTIISSFSMGSPQGIGISDNTLFVCDKQNGFTALDVTNPLAIVSLAIFPFYTKEVIVLENTVLAFSNTQIYQFDYSDLNNIYLVSTFDL